MTYPTKQQVARTLELAEKARDCKECRGKGYVERHQPGHIHYETDSDECPAYHYERIPCSTCAVRTELPDYARAYDRAMSIAQRAIDFLQNVICEDPQCEHEICRDAQSFLRKAAAAIAAWEGKE